MIEYKAHARALQSGDMRKGKRWTNIMRKKAQGIRRHRGGRYADGPNLSWLRVARALVAP